MFDKDISINIQGGLDFELPKMMLVHQKFDDACIEDVYLETKKEIAKLDNVDLSGKRIAITVGSRRIANLFDVLKAIIDYLKLKNAKPFIVPSMGSHAGATSEGQKKFIEGLGITEKELEVPIISDMKTVSLGVLEGGYEVFCDKNAYTADYIIVCGRIKPHTSIKGKVESGLCKMMVVGLGKHKGAASFHKQGYHNLANILPEGGKLFLEKAPILCGIGIVENAYDKTAIIKYVSKEKFIDEEALLLNKAKEKMPKFLLDDIDVLVVDRFGKDISGAGIDPNITGRAITPLPMQVQVRIGSIVVLDLTAVSHGNATGIGGAEFTTKRVVNSIDFSQTYTNVLTSGAIIAAQIPLVLKNDIEAIKVAMRCSPRPSIDKVKMVRILDTLHMGDILVSNNYSNYIKENSQRIEILNEDVKWNIENDRLIAF